MRVSALIRELNISLTILRSYEPFLGETDYRFNVVNQQVPEDIYRKVLELHQSKAFSSSTFIFQDDEVYKYIAQIKWYNNSITKGKYGLIEKKGFPSILVDEKKFIGIMEQDSFENSDIIATVKKEDAHQESINIPAVQLNTINKESDIDFLIFEFSHNFSKLQIATGESIIKRLRSLNYAPDTIAIESNTKLLNTQFNNLHSRTVDNHLVLKLQQLLDFAIIAQINPNTLFEKIKESKPKLLFALWLHSTSYKIEIAEIKDEIITSICSKSANSEAIFERLNKESEGVNYELIITLFFESAIDKLDHLYQALSTKEQGINSFLRKLSALQVKDVFKIWIKIDELNFDFDILEIDAEEFLICFVEHVNENPNSLKFLINRLNPDHQKSILSSFLNRGELIDYSLLLQIINLSEELGIAINYNLIAYDLQIKLWLENNIDFCPFEALHKVIKIESLKYFKHKIQEEPVVYTSEILQKLSDSELKNLIAKIEYEKEKTDEQNTFNVFHLILLCLTNVKRNDTTFNSSTGLFQDIVRNIYDKSSDYYRLILFILDFTDKIDFNSVVIYTGLLSSQNQKLFFKKILKLIALKEIVLDIEDLNRITTIDYETSEYAKEIDGIGLDYTLSIILTVITDLKNNIQTSRNTIFDIIANQIKKPKDLLVIDGFFEKCTGRTVIKESGKTEDDDGNTKINYKLDKKEHILPRFSTFCDGRKSNKLCNKSDLDFWWCENSQCYDLCRMLHSPTQWKDYTLEDALTILKIPYNEGQYEVLLNTINRTNRFLEHLTCRTCNTILTPKGKSNFAFYGVTMFSCKNTECSSRSEEIYLSHCLNGYCEDIIDSRDSVKCITAGFDHECGWYICKNCNACCSSDKLKYRQWILEKNDRKYTCHLDGHRDRGIICCSDCGHELLEKVPDNVLFKKQLEWFIEQKDTNPNIIKSGKRTKDNKWWFIWSRGSFTHAEYRGHLQRLFSSGFNIPDFNDKERDNHLIAEPFEYENNKSSRVFVCPHCDHHFNINNKDDFDYARKRAVQSFHNKIFPVVDN